VAQLARAQSDAAERARAAREHERQASTHPCVQLSTVLTLRCPAERLRQEVSVLQTRLDDMLRGETSRVGDQSQSVHSVRRFGSATSDKCAHVV
jgi:hypothetical protein